eukprot:GEZU01005043.1.p1 GENE.GEZU01005043.1~~GEZU01005043.1.p1  ORF type:complete len:374 (-),score=50.98 GEZU01005043.1:9-1130(-)
MMQDREQTENATPTMYNTNAFTSLKSRASTATESSSNNRFKYLSVASSPRLERERAFSDRVNTVNVRRRILCSNCKLNYYPAGGCGKVCPFCNYVKDTLDSFDRKLDDNHDTRPAVILARLYALQRMQETRVLEIVQGVSHDLIAQVLRDVAGASPVINRTQFEQGLLKAGIKQSPEFKPIFNIFDKLGNGSIVFEDFILVLGFLMESTSSKPPNLLHFCYLCIVQSNNIVNKYELSTVISIYQHQLKQQARANRKLHIHNDQHVTHQLGLVDYVSSKLLSQFNKDGAMSLTELRNLIHRDPMLVEAFGADSIKYNTTNIIITITNSNANNPSSSSSSAVTLSSLPTPDSPFSPLLGRLSTGASPAPPPATHS